MKTTIEGIYQCSRCKHFFTEEEMHSNNTGKFQVCKPCHNLNESERRAANREKQRKYERDYYAAHPEPTRARASKYRANYPDRLKAVNKVNHEIAMGRLVRQPCERCGETNVQAHHDDYSEPLEVTWLCHSCHRKLHLGDK